MISPAIRRAAEIPDGPVAILPIGQAPTIRPQASLDALARFIHRRRRGRGLELRPVTAMIAGHGLPGFSVWFQDPGGHPDFALTVAGVGELGALQAALREAKPEHAQPQRTTPRDVLVLDPEWSFAEA